LSAALFRFWFMHGHYTEGRRWLERALARGGSAPPGLRASGADAAARADEGSDEVFEATLEPEPEAPEEAALQVVPEPEAAPEPEPTPEEPAPAPAEVEAAAEPQAEPEEKEDVTLEEILEDLKRREGRS